MKSLILAYIPTLLRHVTTSLATVGTLLLTKGLITPTDVSAVNTGGSSLAVALVAIATPILSRLAIVVLGKLNLSGSSAATDKVAGWLLCVGFGTAAGFFGLALSSCSPAQIAEAESIPIHASAKIDHGSVGYDSTTGISVVVDARSGK